VVPGGRDSGRLPGRRPDAKRGVRLLHATREQAEQGAVARAEDALYNAKGEFLSTWRREFEPDVDPMAGAVWYREMMAGNGPVFTHNDENWLLQHTTKHTEKGGHGDDAPELWNRPKAEAFWGRFLSKTAEADGRGPVSEVFPGCSANCRR